MAMIGQPAAAQPAPQAPSATDDAAKLAKGRDVFNNYGCASCHTLADAGATGGVGPSFDGDPNLSHDFVVDRVTNGQGPMPSFGGQMTPEEIDAVAAYVVHAAKK
jgi:mono/diheme cytochrome c family protein